MNYLTLITFQRMIFSILFILSGLYLIIFLLKEIFMLFIPRKHNIQDLTELLMNNKDVKIIPLTGDPNVRVKEENLQNKYIQPQPIIKKKEYNKPVTLSPSVIKTKVKEKLKEKVKRKSRKRKDDI